MATYSGILAWKIPRTEEPGTFMVHGVADSATTEATEHICMRVCVCVCVCVCVRFSVRRNEKNSHALKTVDRSSFSSRN